MKDEEASRVSVNHCVRDAELERLEALLAGADPGEWCAVGGKVERYGGKPFEKPGSFALMAESVAVVPRLMRGIRALEEALRTAWAEAKSWKMTVVRERAQHAEDLARYAFGETGPAEDLLIMLEAAELGVERREFLARQITEWAVGKSTQAGIYAIDVIRMRRESDERKRFEAELREEYDRKRRELDALLAELRLTKRERMGIAERVKVSLAVTP